MRPYCSRETMHRVSVWLGELPMEAGIIGRQVLPVGGSGLSGKGVN